jgi:hypothetical protein
MTIYSTRVPLIDLDKILPLPDSSQPDPQGRSPRGIKRSLGSWLDSWAWV